MRAAVLGLDVGGANLKAAHADGRARSRPFELWKHPAGLAGALRPLLDELAPFDRLAVTMTGELCDCFATKREGVGVILDAVAAVAGGAPIRVWLTDGRLTDLAGGRAEPLRAAAANWLALATFAGRFCPAGPALLIDIGSTTTDVIPLRDSTPAPQGRTDPERLRSRELVYTGVRRTPACALLGEAVAAELFATTLDAYLLLGTVAEDADDRGTADGRPATRPHAHSRLARMLGGDGAITPAADTLALARQIHERQRTLIGSAVAEVSARLPAPPRMAILAGSGEFLAESVAADLGLPTVRLADRLGPVLSACACAYAVARLSAEGEGP